MRTRSVASGGASPVIARYATAPSVTYFCICLQLPRNAPAALCSQVCPQIRETIMAGLRKASATLHYNNCVPRDAFLCGEHSDSTTSPHATVVDGSRTVMTCSRNPAEVCTVLTEQHLAWFGSQRSAGAVKLTTPGEFDYKHILVLQLSKPCALSVTAWRSGL